MTTRAGWRLVFVGVCAATSCSRNAPPEASPAVESGHAVQPPAATDTAAERWVAVQEANNAPAFELIGRLLPPPNAHAELTLPLPATVLRVLVDHGKQVERGAPLVEVAMPEAARATGRLEGARLRMEAYRARLTHLETLRTEGLARGAELADARARLAEASADEHEALAVQQMVEAAGLRRRGNHYEVLAPLSGVVVEVDAPLGSMRGPSDGPVVKISGGTPTRIEARASFPLPKGARYEWVAGLPGAPALRLVSEAPEIMPEDATHLVWFDAERPIELPHGSIVHVRVVPPDNSWLVPSTAVLHDAAQPAVRTRRAGRVAVDVLCDMGNDTLVRGALQSSDMVAERRGGGHD
jgi:hypothetical protein